ncbi:MAG: hypothetical protein J6M34_03940 [Clostridia bacterium]|nr:hypothetical protein [Clostridia bacterium]
MNKHFSRARNTPFFRPPTTVTVDGTAVPIRWDFETAFLFAEYVDRSEDADETFLDTVLSIWYPQIPANRDGALDAAIRFYCGGNAPKEGYYRPVMDPTAEREEIYLKFLKHYGIDLNRERMHWWIFRRLAEGLDERRPS